MVRGHSRKKERLLQLLSAQGMCGELLRFPSSIPLPLQPDLHATGILAERSGVFNSAMAPLKLCFRLSDGPGAQLLVHPLPRRQQPLLFDSWPCSARERDEARAVRRCV